MVRCCSAWYCFNRDSPEFREPPLNIRFFRFPKNETLRQKWTVAVSSGRRDGFKPNDSSILCSIHFELSDFSEISQRLVLRPDAVPTLFFVPNSDEERRMKEPNEVRKKAQGRWYYAECLLC
jgi:THAP domain